MFYDVDKAIAACEDEPSLIFELMKEEHFELVDKILTKKIVDINTCDENGMNVLTKLLKYGQYELVLKHMKNKSLDINHQDNDGNTFAHMIVSVDYKKIVKIIQQLKRIKDFAPNIKNNDGETILDKSIKNDYLYTTVKILEDSRFNNIDIVSFKNLYDTYIKSNNYGKQTKLMNLEIIVESLEERKLLPSIEKIIIFIKENFDRIKAEIFSEKKKGYLDEMITTVMKESNAY